MCPLKPNLLFFINKHLNILNAKLFRSAPAIRNIQHRRHFCLYFFLSQNFFVSGHQTQKAHNLIGRKKLPAMLLSLREPPVRSSKVSCDVGCCSSFHFCSSFCCCCSSHCFSTSSLTFPWNIAGFLHTFYTFSPAHRRAIRDSFILIIPRSSFHSFTASATVLSGHFLPTGVFYLTLLHQHFTYVYQGIAGSRQLFFEFCSVSC